MSNPKNISRNDSYPFGHADKEFISEIAEIFLQRSVYKLVGESSIDTRRFPIVKRHDDTSFEIQRLHSVMGYMMGRLHLDINDIQCGSLMGLHDHKGALTSFWCGIPDMEQLGAIHDGWSAWYEEQHIAVAFGGVQDSESHSYDVYYETAC
jgi:hypothetical protein